MGDAVSTLAERVKNAEVGAAEASAGEWEGPVKP